MRSWRLTRERDRSGAGPWRTADQVKLATAAQVAWWNDQRLRSACGDIPPAEFEAAYDQRLQATSAAA